MKQTTLLSGLMVLALLTGCAANTPKTEKAGDEGQSVKFNVSDRAMQLIEEQGKASAAMAGFSRGSELICERWSKVGSHIKIPVCYTRAEYAIYQANMQDALDRRYRNGPCLPVVDPTSFGRPNDPRNLEARTPSDCANN